MIFMLMAKRERDGSKGGGDAPTNSFGSEWKCSRLAGYVGISGPFNLTLLKEHLIAQGMDLNGMVDEIFENDLTSFSPSSLARGDAYHRHASVTKLFPSVLLMHGTADNTVPEDQAHDFGGSKIEVY